MFNIAICDDEKSITAQLEDILLDFSKKHSIQLNIEAFYTGEALWDTIIKDEYYDIIFIDIELAAMNGIEVGKRIREELNSQSTQIIYISAKNSYAMELFQVRPLNFLVKPLMSNKIESVLLTALRLMDNNNQYFKYMVGHNYNKIIIKDILYFESDNRKINIYTTKDQISFYGILSEVLEELEEYGFLYIHQSYIVNYNYIISSEYNRVTMTNDTILPISQSRRKIIREQQLYLARKGI